MKCVLPAPVHEQVFVTNEKGSVSFVVDGSPVHDDTVHLHLAEDVESLVIDNHVHQHHAEDTASGPTVLQVDGAADNLSNSTYLSDSECSFTYS